jgi:putative membrane protein
MESADAVKDPAFDGAALSAVIGACAVATAGALVLSLLPLGSLAGHMAVHIAVMNVAAPLAAVGLAHRRPAKGLTCLAAKGLWLATLAQMGLLWASHSPPIHHAAQASTTAYVALHGALFLSALVFWTGVVASPARWHVMLALLLSGKLACLLGALLIFAPRVLLIGTASAHGSHASPIDYANLDDQQLAGLLMIVACPLSYVLAAIVLAARTVTGLERERAPVFSGGAGAWR